MRLKPLLLLLCFLAMLILGEAWDSRDLDELAVYSSEGYDLKDGEVSIHVTGISSAFTSNGEAKSMVLASSGTTLGHSRNDRSLGMPDEVMYGTLRTVLFGRALAGQGVAEYVDTNFRSPQTRLSAYMAVSEGQTSELYAVKGDAEDVGGLLSEILRTADQNSFVPVVTLRDFALTLLSCDYGDALLPMLAPSDTGVKVSGLAVFDGDRMVGSLQGEQAMAAVLLRGSPACGYASFTATLPDGQTDRGTLFLKNSRRVELTLREGVPHYRLIITLKGALVGHESNAPITENAANRRAVEQAFAGDMQALCEQTVALVQQTFGCDCIDITRFAKRCLRRDAPADIREIITDCRIEVQVRCSLVRSGEVS